jgi:signal transduction histidine kinase
LVIVPENLVSRWWRALRGVLLGALTAFPALPRNAVRRTRRQLDRIARGHSPVEVEPLTRDRCTRYLLARSLVGLLGAGVLLMLVLGLLTGLSMLTAWLVGGTWSVIENGSDEVSTPLLLLAAIPGVPLLFGTIAGVFAVSTLDHELAARMLGPSQEAVVRRRIDEVIEAINDERRRIERDLHDGVQQRLVAVGMLIGRARRAAEPTELLRQAHEAAQDAIADLREVASRVYPAALDAGGLHEALQQLAERASVRVNLDHRAGEPGTALATVIYFVVSESVTNAAKHADPSEVEVTVSRDDDHLVVRVSDDGRGGADPAGSGLQGLKRRVEAAGGTFAVRSGEGTVVEARLPCG